MARALRIGLISDTHGLLIVNPGSAGRRRFRLPVSVGELLIEGRSVGARTVELSIEAAA